MLSHGGTSFVPSFLLLKLTVCSFLGPWANHARHQEPINNLLLTPLGSFCSLAVIPILLFVSSSRNPKAAQPERWPLHWFLRIRMWWLGGWECFGAWRDLGHWLFNHQRKELQCIEGSPCQRREELFRCEEFLVICALWNSISMPCRGAFFLGKPHLAGAAPGIFPCWGITGRWEYV